MITLLIDYKSSALSMTQNAFYSKFNELNNSFFKKYFN